VVLRIVTQSRTHTPHHIPLVKRGGDILNIRWLMQKVNHFYLEMQEFIHDLCECDSSLIQNIRQFVLTFGKKKLLKKRKLEMTNYCTTLFCREIS